MRTSWIVILAAAAGCLAASLATAQDDTPAQADSGPVTVEVRTLDGKTQSGPIEALTADALTLGSGESIARDALMRVGFATTTQAPDNAVRVSLIDGSEIAATSYTSDGRTVSLTTAGGAQVSVPAGRVSEVRFRELDEQLTTDWQAIRDRRLPGDLLILDKDGQLEPLQGALGEVTEDRVNFTVTDVGTVKARRDRLYGIQVVQPREVRLPEAICEVTETDGTKWQATSIQLKDQELVLATAMVPELKRPLSSISVLDFARGRILYLTDLEPVNSQVTPFFPHTFLVEETTGYEPRSNVNHLGDPLAIGTRQFTNGLALRGGTELTFALRGGFSRFQAVAGIDASVAKQGTGDVELIISGDNRRLLTAPLTFQDEPRVIELDVTGVERLFIRVNWGTHRLDGDYLNLCEAKLIK
jgi:hypothetical protein